MAEFSPADAALEGFRIGRENPAGLAIWTLLMFAASLITLALTIKTGAAQAMQAFMDLPEAARADPDVVWPAMQQAIVPFLVAQWPLVLALLIVQAAVLRMALRPAGRQAYFRMGADEARMVAAYLLVQLVTAAATFLVILAGAVVSAVVPALGALIALFGSAAVWIFMSVRTFLIYPQVIADGSLSLPRAWGQSRGLGWRILAAQALSLVFALMVVLLGSVVSAAIRAVGGEPEAAGPITSMARLMAPAELGAILVESLLRSLAAVLLIAPAAVIYAAIRRDGA